MNSSIVGASIEGEKILVTGIKITASGRPRLLTTHENTMVFPVDVKRGGESTILLENNPKIYKVREASILDLNSIIKGNMLWGFSSEVPSGFAVGQKGRSHAHSGQELELSGFCYMIITHSWNNKALDRHPKELLLH